MRDWIIAEWREAWRFASLWIGTLAIALLSAWDAMPAELRDELLGGHKIAVGMVLWVALLVARLARQGDGRGEAE